MREFLSFVAAFGLILIFADCNRENNYFLFEPDKVGDILKSDSEDTSKGIIYMYYKDSIKLNFLIQNYQSNSITSLDTNFIISNDKLYLKNPNNINKTYFIVLFKNKNINTCDTLKIKVRFWIKNAYNLKAIVNYFAPKFIYTHDDTTFSIIDNKLFFSTIKNHSKVFCSNFSLVDLFYNQMICKYGYYVIRTGGLIYVSNDLHNWKMIFNGARGIKQSMVIVHNQNGFELLFSMYTPGTNYVRHYLRSYNLETGITSVRMTFYTAEDYNTYGLSPQARHIHFLVEDPYSNLIFMGTGDIDAQCGIYFSNDFGITFKRLGGGNQKWRALSMIFTKEYIFWNMDSAKPQYLNRLSRDHIVNNVDETFINQFPLINGALWCSEVIHYGYENNDMFIMSSNNEGRLYDHNFRNYGIIINSDGIPVAYELVSKYAADVYAQFFPIGVDYDNIILFCDVESKRYIRYTVNRIVN